MRKRLCTLLLAVLVLLTALPWAAADDSTPPQLDHQRHLRR